MSTEDTIVLDSSSPAQLGSGTVTSVLGKGGAAVVYEIWNSKLEVRRAVKLWRPNLSNRMVERFETEIKITAKLHHENIVEIHSVGEWNSLPYIEMEKIDGHSLKQLLKTRGAFPHIAVLAVGMHICRALSYAHSQKYQLFGAKHKGIVHCDIKPANVMITKKGVVKLMDFGIAMPTDIENDPNIFSGSLQYSSPEQIASQQIDPRTDIYSLGIVLYEMLSGTKAFPAKNLQDLVRKRKKNVFTSLDEFCKEIHPSIRKIVAKCTETDRDKRYQDTGSLLADLKKVYDKMTAEQPERVIKMFLSEQDMKLVTRKSHKTLLPLSIITMIIIAACVIGYQSDLYEIREKIGLTGYDEPEISNPPISMDEKKIESTPAVVKESPGIISIVDKSPNDKKSVVKEKPSFAWKSKAPVKKPKGGSEKKLISAEKNQPALQKSSDESRLDELSRLIDMKNWKSAGALFERFHLNDGEYLLLLSQYQCGLGKWKEALETAETGFRTRSMRLSPDRMQGLLFVCKAKCLTSEFNAAPDIQKGQVAMEAWYNVKYFYRSAPSNRAFQTADEEIRRISSSIKR